MQILVFYHLSLCGRVVFLIFSYIPLHVLYSCHRPFVRHQPGSLLHLFCLMFISDLSDISDISFATMPQSYHTLRSNGPSLFSLRCWTRVGWTRLYHHCKKENKPYSYTSHSNRSPLSYRESGSCHKKHEGTLSLRLLSSTLFQNAYRSTRSRRHSMHIMMIFFLRCRDGLLLRAVFHLGENRVNSSEISIHGSFQVC